MFFLLDALSKIQAFNNNKAQYGDTILLIWPQILFTFRNLDTTCQTDLNLTTLV